jgi:hypothetical protein
MGCYKTFNTWVESLKDSGLCWSYWSFSFLNAEQQNDIRIEYCIATLAKRNEGKIEYVFTHLEKWKKVAYLLKKWREDPICICTLAKRKEAKIECVLGHLQKEMKERLNMYSHTCKRNPDTRCLGCQKKGKKHLGYCAGRLCDLAFKGFVSKPSI